VTPTCNWFLAHAKQTEDETVDGWLEALAARLSSDAVRARVVAGRDDYKERSRAMGGWNSWVRDVPTSEDWAGDALFHGIVVPCTGDIATVGRATQTLVEGFLMRGKYAYAWFPETDELRKVVDVRELEGDSWTAAACLFLE